VYVAGVVFFYLNKTSPTPMVLVKKKLEAKIHETLSLYCKTVSISVDNKKTGALLALVLITHLVLIS
jgi:hypothetical protein